MKSAEYGFVAFWKATSTWFDLEQSKKDQFMEELETIVENAKKDGIKTYGNFDCSWSSEWKYFTFWECESIEILQDTIDKLYQIGDIHHFNVQHHYVGKKSENTYVQ